jgi:two-component sensor histidine kinase
MLHFQDFKMAAAVTTLSPTQFIPANEIRRMAAIRRYDILDTPPDGSFDRITALAADLFSVPISIISLVDHDRIWFKSHHGLNVQQIDRAPGLCASAILQDDPWILTDAKTDIRSLANPLVAGEFGLRFYVGVPLRTTDGHNLGTLCVIDREARSVTEKQISQLKNLASVVMDQMELRLSARQAVAEMSDVIAEKDLALRRSAMMAKEIDHRVKNSLQLISGLLKLQSRALDNPDAAEQLTLAASRVFAIARVHEHIYMTERVESTDCKTYLRRLCDDLSSMLRPDDEASIVVEAVEAEFPTERIVSVGLILHELVTNAAKHGSGKIFVGFENVEAGGYALTVTDEGPGLPPDFDPTKARGLGMKVVRSLAKQHGGELQFGPGPNGRGARFTVLIAGQDQAKTH